MGGYDDHGACAYLSPEWFTGLRDAVGDRALVATARRDGAIVAASLAFHAGRHLYGRYWGSLVDVPSLHFELCYYRWIAWALEHGVTRVEAGAQGRHKIPRGYLPSFTHSAHWVRHEGLHSAIADHVVQETAVVRRQAATLAGESPYRAGVVAGDGVPDAG